MNPHVRRDWASIRCGSPRVRSDNFTVHAGPIEECSHLTVTKTSLHVNTCPPLFAAVFATMECPVCLLADNVDTDGARCVCGRLFHASCVYALLKNGYKTCPTCFARLPPNLFLLGASHGHSLDGSVLSTINFAARLPEPIGHGSRSCC